VRFALDLAIFGDLGDPALLLELGMEAEAAGWDGYFLWDHLLADDPATPVTDPWVVFAALAVRTETIRFGPMVTPLARRRMPKLARESVALDHLSGGRFVLGAGLGEHDEREFGAFGDMADRRTRAHILDESLEVLGGLWSGEPFTYTGTHLRISTTGFRPTPRQGRRIPVWVAGLWPYTRGMRRAAGQDGAFPIKAGAGFESQMSPAEMADVHAYVRRHRVDDAPFDLVHAGLLSGERGRDHELADRYAAAGVTWWLEHIYPGRMPVDGIRELIGRGPPRTG
jgi:alkanesulfonate monooxygenase SsuD/methylene tetrahydromethanopterin reductase-like flavin-dependent oxidoreductase (luciferase family)